MNKITRRTLFAGAGAAGAGLLMPAIVGRARAQAGQVRMLSRSHFIPQYEAWIKKLAAQFQEETGIEIVSDHIAQAELAVRYVSEVSAQGGHDIVELIDPFTLLPVYSEHLLDVTDIAEELGERNGGWLPVAESYCKQGDTWKGILNYYIDHSSCYRRDLLDQVGEGVPDTWDDVLRAGRKLKEIGHPVGQSFARGADSTSSFNALMWAFDSSWTSPDGQEITIRSAETREALEFARDLYHDTMTPEVLSWDDAGNNRFMISGRGSWTLNAPSVYKTAMADAPHIGENIYHTLPPAGPRGTRLNYSQVYGYGIWNFSPNAQNAKRWLAFMVENWMGSYSYVSGYNYPGLRAHADQIAPILKANPHIADLIGIPEIARPVGYPGPISKVAGEVATTFVIPDMFSQVARGTDIDEAIGWAERRILDIQARHT